MSSWRDEYVVRSYESDAGGRLSPAFALRYLQESAWNHARGLGWAFDPREGGPNAWVLSRLRLTMNRYPAWGERVTVETWPLGIDRMLALRDFRLLDAAGAECGRASTGWLIIDVDARRPRRPEQALPGLQAFAGPQPVAGVPARLEAVAPPWEERAVEVLASDIDVNGHVNNVRYLDWAIDGLPAARLAECEVRALEAAFISEALLGETATVRWAAGAAESRHTIVGRDREICRLRLLWEPRRGCP